MLLTQNSNNSSSTTYSKLNSHRNLREITWLSSKDAAAHQTPPAPRAPANPLRIILLARPKQWQGVPPHKIPSSRYARSAPLRTTNPQNPQLLRLLIPNKCNAQITPKKKFWQRQAIKRTAASWSWSADEDVTTDPKRRRGAGSKTLSSRVGCEDGSGFARPFKAWSLGFTSSRHVEESWGGLHVAEIYYPLGWGGRNPSSSVWRDGCLSLDGWTLGTVQLLRLLTVHFHVQYQFEGRYQRNWPNTRWRNEMGMEVYPHVLDPAPQGWADGWIGVPLRRNKVATAMSA